MKGKIHNFIYHKQFKIKNFDERKSIRKFAIQSGYQTAIQQSLNQEITNINKFMTKHDGNSYSIPKKYSNKINNTNKSYHFFSDSGTMTGTISNLVGQQTDSRGSSILKSLGLNNKIKPSMEHSNSNNKIKFDSFGNYIDKENQVQNFNKHKYKEGIRGIKPDGFDIYKPSKMLKKKNWNDHSNRKSNLKGVIIKKKSFGSDRISKKELFKKNFIDPKKKEIEELKNKNLEIFQNLQNYNFSANITQSESHNLKLKNEFIKSFNILKEKSNQ